MNVRGADKTGLETGNRMIPCEKPGLRSPEDYSGKTRAVPKFLNPSDIDDSLRREDPTMRFDEGRPQKKTKNPDDAGNKLDKRKESGDFT
jgi:hypothetical protein